MEVDVVMIGYGAGGGNCVEIWDQYGVNVFIFEEGEGKRYPLWSWRVGDVYKKRVCVCVRVCVRVWSFICI